MPQAKFNGAEIDGNLKIEDGVRNTLESNSIAAVSAKGIEAVYDLYVKRLPSQQCTLIEKCGAIAKEAGADSFEIRGDDVWFRKKPTA